MLGGVCGIHYRGYLMLGVLYAGRGVEYPL